LVLSRAPHLLKENGGSLELGESWAQSLFRRMRWVIRDKTTGGKSLCAEVESKVDAMREEFHAIREHHNIVDALCINFDQTMQLYYATRGRTLAPKGDHVSSYNFPVVT